MVARLILPFSPLLLLMPGLLAWTLPGQAQELDLAPSGSESSFPTDRPPPPDPPEVISRDAAGNATVRAVRLDEPLVIDGALDEDLYRTVPPISGLVQSLPDFGVPATEETEIWVAYDDTNIYVSARLWDAAPEREWIANEMRRNTDQLRQNDTFGVAFDTFHDRRNGVMFYTNPLGAMADFAITNEGNPNADWNPIWEVRTGRFDGGWTVEMAIPFRSLRYRSGPDHVWGVQFRRAIRHKNEWVHLTPVPRAWAGTGAQGIFRVSGWGTLVGLETPQPTFHADFKPYAISGVRTDRAGGLERSNELDTDLGVDVKYGLTRSLTLDLTYNTDFAQVEVDEQQVNLTRFDLFFPEKREFFLEGRDLFEFGLSGFGAGRGSERAPTLFFSRRIGLEAGEPVPIFGGARLTGKIGDFDVGALGIRTSGEEATGVAETDFTVLRMRRDVLSRSNVGVLFGHRSESVRGGGSNQTYGFDGNFTLFDNLTLLTHLAGTRTHDREGRDSSYQIRGSYSGDEWAVQALRLLVEENFDPQIGFVRLTGFLEHSGSVRYSPRPTSIPSIRQFNLEVGVDYREDAPAGSVESRERRGRFDIEFENSDMFTLTAVDSRERLTSPFEISDGVTIPVGTYPFQELEVAYTLGLQRRTSGTLMVRGGTFYSGNITSVGWRRGRVEVLPQLSIEPSVSFNWVELEEGSFTTHVAATRVNYSFTPRMFVSGLLQFSSEDRLFTNNLRFRWEYSPGSELFIVYTEDRNTDTLDRFSELSNRALVIKVTRLFRP